MDKHLLDLKIFTGCIMVWMVWNPRLNSVLKRPHFTHRHKLNMSQHVYHIEIHTHIVFRVIRNCRVFENNFSVTHGENIGQGNLFNRSDFFYHR